MLVQSVSYSAKRLWAFRGFESYRNRYFRTVTPLRSNASFLEMFHTSRVSLHFPGSSSLVTVRPHTAFTFALSTTSCGRHILEGEYWKQRHLAYSLNPVRSHSLRGSIRHIQFMTSIDMHNQIHPIEVATLLVFWVRRLYSAKKLMCQ